MCYNKYMKKFSALFFLMAICVFGSWGVESKTANVSSPLLVGGSFSTQVNATSQNAFDQAARDEEIASLREKLRNTQYEDVIRRINFLTANNHMDDRFYLLLAIAFDGLEKYDDVVYSAGQAIAVAPQDARAYILRCRAYIKQNNYERANIDVETALKLNPSSTDRLCRGYFVGDFSVYLFPLRRFIPSQKELLFAQRSRCKRPI